MKKKIMKNKGVSQQKPLFHFPPLPFFYFFFWFESLNSQDWEPRALGSSLAAALLHSPISLLAQGFHRKWRSCLTKPASFLISDLIFPRYAHYRSSLLDFPGFDVIFFRFLMCFFLRLVLCSAKAEDGGRAVNRAPRVPHRTRASRESRESLSVFYFRSNCSPCLWVG